MSGNGFTVRGSLDDTLYEVEVTGNAGEPVKGSQRVAGLVRQYDGETVLATPQGPRYVVNGADPESILALLSAHTKVTSVGSMGQSVPSLVDAKDPATIR